MEVTRRNYYSLLPELKKAVSEASFIAIDCEFTGLSSCGRDLEVQPFDTPQQYYEKEYQRALDFLVLQFGACVFRFDDKEKRYSYQAFNFYLFPATTVKGGSSLTFLCQSSSIAFLAKNGFDFNKAFGEGISFMTQDDEDRLREIMQERHSKMNSNAFLRDMADIQIPEGKRTHLEKNLSEIESFFSLSEDGSETKNGELVLKNCTSLMRRLLYQEVPKKFGDTLYMETQDDFNIVVARNSEELRKKKLEDRKKRELNNLENAVGFSQFIKLLSTSGKPIIGHNCLLDLCHTVNSFRYPLPADYDDFKELMHHVFPSIFDTKYMAETSRFQELIPSSVLGHLLKTVNEPPFEMPPVVKESADRGYDVNIDKSHEAGYDAFMTGLCFLSMCHYMCKEQGRSFGSLNTMSDILKVFENRIHLSRIQDVPYIQLGGPDRKPPRGHVFHLTFPREWRLHEINELFKPFGPVFVSFLNDESAFVALQRRNQADIVLRTMTENRTYKLTPFSTFEKELYQKKFLLQTEHVNADASKKRKVLAVDSQSPQQIKKLCNQQKTSDSPMRSSGSNEDRDKRNSPALDLCSGKSEENTTITVKEFPETDDW